MEKPHFQLHNEPNDHDPTCTQSFGKYINLFESQTQNKTNIKNKSIPKKKLKYQTLNNWIAKFLQWAGIMEFLHQHQQSPKPEGSPKYYIWVGFFCRSFTGTRNINDPSFMSIPSVTSFLIYVDCFNKHGKSSCLARIAPIMLIYLNLLQKERLKPENVYASGIIPGSKEPTSFPLNYLLMLLIKELTELCKRLPSFTHFNKSFRILYPCCHPQGP
ncbi:hypothetical protein O181_044861 [Austropuccinia psidii MF-1]|uniref:Uncharacterized protein n=1 Tax=Austropuccinia psidii MF-1 TaxID=1389203 RepID=A0A9Q3DR82_9BASI|nr:hypothetical protein [Austropuccinia psidii MF-1]